MTIKDLDQKVTPMMAQWHACKKIAGDAILLFRLGDFYEAFYEDAEIVSKALDLTLTKRQDVPMSGVPFHTCETYIDRLVTKGFRIAVAEQTEDAKLAKGLVKREIVRVVTPGTVINSSLLSEKSNNYFASLAKVGRIFGFSFLDLTTGDFRVIEFEQEQDLLNEIYRIHPSEFLFSRKFQESHALLISDMKATYHFLINVNEEWHFDHQITCNFLTNHFKVHSLDGFGLRGMTVGINAAGALLAYIQEQLCLPINHVTNLEPYTTSNYMSLDRNTQRNLELTESLNDRSKKNTLVDVIDQTCTPMGGRLIRQWVKQPLLDVDEIRKRQEAVGVFEQNPKLSEALYQQLNHIRDLERLMVKISSGYATPRDLVILRYSLEPLPQIKTLLTSSQPIPLLIANEVDKLEALPQLAEFIAKAIVDEPPIRVSDCNVIRDQFDDSLDELRDISRNSKNWIARYQTSLREQTGIKTLKVGYNKMFGYFIEVSRGQSERVPDHFERRQTLVNAERYISPQLKEYETKVLTAQEKIAAIESELFDVIRAEVAKYAPQIQRMAQALAKIDVLRSLGEVAKKNGYVRPKVEESRVLKIIEGRHPVIEAASSADRFVPNDTILDDNENRLLLITGPNMAGKSTYIRQVALITIMAQIGSYVPAKSAQIGIVDKVFTRIGASDDLSRGQSTFMVEMTETANILNNATSRSLVILDEIGRGTSTYDGISIAWSVAEYLLTCEGKMAKTLFATHYWELTKLEEKIPGAVNYNVAVHESNDHIVFLRKIVKGGTDKSYGIHVGRLAGLPKDVIERAKEILVHLEENANRKGTFEPALPKMRKTKSKTSGKSKPPVTEYQLTFFN